MKEKEKKKRKTETNQENNNTFLANPHPFSYNEKVIKSRAKFVFIISLLVFVISFAMKAIACLLEPTEQSILVLITNAVSSFLESTSGIILGVSIGSMLLDFFSYVKYSQERIQEVVVDKKFLNTMNNGEKKRIIDALESSLYFSNQPIPSDSLYKNIKEKVTPLIEREYLIRCFTHIDCFIENNQTRKEIYNELSIFSPNDNFNFTLPFSIVFEEDHIKNMSSPFSIKDIKCNGEKTILGEIQPESFVQNNIKYVRYNYNQTFQLNKGENTIIYTTCSYVGLSDNTYSKSVTIPCKNFILEFAIHNENYIVKAYGFSMDKVGKVSTQYYHKSCRVEFSDWIFPGDGCIFVISKK